MHLPKEDLGNWPSTESWSNLASTSDHPSPFSVFLCINLNPIMAWAAPEALWLTLLFECVLLLEDEKLFFISLEICLNLEESWVDKDEGCFSRRLAIKAASWSGVPFMLCTNKESLATSKVISMYGLFPFVSSLNLALLLLPDNFLLETNGPLKAIRLELPRLSESLTWDSWFSIFLSWSWIWSILCWWIMALLLAS